jgi:hypothetical protein
MRTSLESRLIKTPLLLLLPLLQAGISAIRRLRKTDNNRIARATGATICHRIEEVRRRQTNTVFSSQDLYVICVRHLCCLRQDI